MVFWWPEKKLLFINGSTNAGEFKNLAQAVAGPVESAFTDENIGRTYSTRVFAGVDHGHAV